MTATAMDPSTRFVRSLDGDYLKVGEAAEQLGVSHQKLRELLKEDPELGPSYCAFFGKIKIYLYTQDDVERIRKYLTERKTLFRPGETARTGRPPIWTPEQRQRRQRLYSATHYYRRRVEALTAEGKEEAARAAQARVDEMTKELDEMEPASA